MEATEKSSNARKDIQVHIKGWVLVCTC